MTQPEINKTLNKYKKITVKQEDYLHAYANIKFETLSYLKELKHLSFPIYFFQNEELFEVATPGLVVAEDLDHLVSAKIQANSTAAICIKQIDFEQYEAVMDQIRGKKIDQLFNQQENLNKKLLDQFSALCQASQLLEFSRLNASVMKRVTDITEKVAQQSGMETRGLHTLCRLIKADPTLYDHGASVGLMSGIFASQALSKSNVETAKIIRCGLIHDFGKNYIPPEILHKPGLLTSDEFKLVKTHTSVGSDELNRMLTLDTSLHIEPELITVAHEHHEKFHGHGYPLGKSGRLEEKSDGIHEYSRIVLIVDIFTALLMKQDYREAYSPARALQIMSEDAERDYDPILWNRFKEFVENSVEEMEDSTPYVQRSGRFSVNDLIKKRQGIKNVS